MDQPGDQHLCYQCLLGDLQKDRLERMKQLARFRRALWVIYDRDEDDSARYTQKSFAEKLGQSNQGERYPLTKNVVGYDTKIAAFLIARLKREHFLTQAKFPSPVKTNERVQDRIRIYGDPYTSIAMHVCGWHVLSGSSLTVIVRNTRARTCTKDTGGRRDASA